LTTDLFSANLKTVNEEKMNTRLSPRELALALLQRSTCNVRVGAVLSDRKGIYAWGWNFGESSMPFRRGTHAEEHAIRRANRKRLQGSTITVAGMRRNGHFVYSKPCAEICLPLCKKHGIEVIEFVDKSGTWVTMKLDYVRSA
jgi:tRNA(Arg) A34 adenosine deaminase TadA